MVSFLSMFNKVLVGLFLTAFIAVLSLSKPLNLKVARGSEPISASIRGTVRVVSTPLSGVRVRLFTIIDNRKVLISQTATDTSGEYYFQDLKLRKYAVQPTSRLFIFDPVRKIVDLTNCTADCNLVGIDFQATSR